MPDSHSSSNANSANEVASLIAEFASDDGLRRQEARRAVESIGSLAVPSLVDALGNKKQRIRWEAAKALVKIKDPAAASALVQALMDENFEIQWLAAEALIELGRDAVRALLEGLLTHYESVYLRQGAHHVFYELERKDLLNDKEAAVIDELRSIDPSQPFPDVTRQALAALDIR